MYFNFEDRSFETPTVESAMSWREQFLLSVFAHAVVVLLLFLVPQLSIVKAAAERRTERLNELAELQAQARREARDDDTRPFVFVQPRVDLDATEPPSPDADLSDKDRVAQSPLRTLDPDIRLPLADGNTPEFVVTDDPNDGITSTDTPGLEDRTEDEAEVPEALRLADGSAGRAEAEETAADLSDNPGSRSELEDVGAPTFADSSLTQPGAGPGDPDERDERRIDILPDGLLGQAARNLRRSAQRQTFRNLSGDTGRYGPEIEFDTKGVEFGPWIRRFVAQIKRNWFVPYAIWSMHGHVVITFNVHRDGSLTDLAVARPSGIEAFNNSAFNALRASNPTQPLPPEYPDDQAFFTVTFFFNELPPAQ